MIFIWGSKFYGKTDEVSGLFHVESKFGHLWYFPLIPMSSHLVMEKTSDGWRGADIPLSGKSILLGWLRTICLIGGVGFLLAGLGARGNEGYEKVIMIVVGGLGLVLAMVFSFYGPFRYASYNRAMQLGDMVRLNEKGRALLQLQYGVINEEEAERVFSRNDEEDSVPWMRRRRK